MRVRQRTDSCPNHKNLYHYIGSMLSIFRCRIKNNILRSSFRDIQHIILDNDSVSLTRRQYYWGEIIIRTYHEAQNKPIYAVREVFEPGEGA